MQSGAAQALTQILAGSDVAAADAPVFAAHASVRAVKSAWQSSGFEKIAQRPDAHKNSTSAYNALEAMLEKLGYSDVESDKVLVAMRALTRDRATGEARFEKVTFCEFCAHLAQLVGPPSLAQYYVNDAVRRAGV